jgi:hypothetical protein
MKLIYLEDQIKGQRISLLLDMLHARCCGPNNFFLM